MKRLLTIMMCLLAMMAASLSAMAQEVTITLYPGCNWISYPNSEMLDINTALGDFVPVDGDIIQSQVNYSVYVNGQWRGSVTHFMPGWGYKYYSNRTEVVSFVFTGASPLVVTTSEPNDITAVSAVVGGTVTVPEGGHVFLRGVCWGTEPGPDIDGDHTTEETGIGSFSSTLEDLAPYTTYYVRAYVVLDSGLSYGNEVSFTTFEDGGSSNVPEGAICGKFTINANGDQVYFSQGNLQYQASTNTWRFAENQWDYVGGSSGSNEYGNVYENGVKCDNTLISSNYDGWIDLFGWGTSGYNHGAVCYQPWSTNDATYTLYLAYGNAEYNLYDQTGQADWGYNAIINGANTENCGWRTLTENEWTYIIETRAASTLNGTANARFAKARVAGVLGVILFPDCYLHPTEVSLPIGINDTGTTGWNGNNYTAIDFAMMENNGAVFLPDAGERSSTAYINHDSRGHYWLSSRSINYIYSAKFIDIDSSRFRVSSLQRWYGHSVRLIKNCNP